MRLVNFEFGSKVSKLGVLVDDPQAHPQATAGCSIWLPLLVPPGRGFLVLKHGRVSGWRG